MKKYLIISIIILLLGAVVFFLFFKDGSVEEVVDQDVVEIEMEEKDEVQDDGLLDVEGITFERKKLPIEFENDKDRDGILDEKEAELGTSDLDADTDGDGLRDIDEINKWGTDPTKVDTDGDGFADAVELLNGYNPNGEGLFVNFVN